MNQKASHIQQTTSVTNNISNGSVLFSVSQWAWYGDSASMHHTRKNKSAMIHLLFRPLLFLTWYEDMFSVKSIISSTAQFNKSMVWCMFCSVYSIRICPKGQGRVPATQRLIFLASFSWAGPTHNLLFSPITNDNDEHAGSSILKRCCYGNKQQPQSPTVAIVNQNIEASLPEQMLFKKWRCRGHTFTMHSIKEKLNW